MAGLPKIDVTDIALFGNEASELEDEEVFFSYAVNRKELENFLDEKALIQVVSSYKGEGKSGLLRLVRRQLAAGPDSPLVISAIGTDLSPPLNSDDSDEWTRAWKERIIRLIASEIGTRIGVAMTDDTISLVEHAELAGFKSRSIVSALFDRLKTPLAQVTRDRLGVENPERLIQRYAKGKSTIWLIIDDVDQNFENTARHRLKIATFFIACRQLVTSVPELRFRISVRPNIWSILKRQFEGLSHLQQYICNLFWTADDYRSLLAKRVQSYLERNGQWAITKKYFAVDQSKRELQLIGLVFEDPMPWGGDDRLRQPHAILHTLSKHRPRWLVELCKAAAKSLDINKKSKIGLDELTAVLPAFGQRRIDDAIAEFGSQCPQLSELLSAFSRQNERYTTDELIKTLRDRIMMAVHPQIAGITPPASEVAVAHFLFQIGFLTARRDVSEKHYEHIVYADAPHLLKDRTNLDDGVSWEIHPVYRQTLQLKNVPTKFQKH
ncbi:MAG: hypothetical protein K8F27_00215 [Sulfuricellaceae bacterium]|nr:hypothetical protein [Sulfuricellaceae bacterium]